MTTIEALVCQAKSRRRALGLVSTYTGVNGPFEMAHPTEAHKVFYDFKYALRAKYASKDEVPAGEMKELEQLHAAAKKSVRPAQ